MQEATRTKTDAHGKFTLELPDHGVDLVRVTHDKANYFQPVEPGAQSVDIDVHTAAARSTNPVNEAEVMHVQTDPGGNSSSVVASFFVKTCCCHRRRSSAIEPSSLTSRQARSSKGRSHRAGQDGDAGTAGCPAGRSRSPLRLYFPLRPCGSKAEAAQDTARGETRFQVSFRLPYTGSLALDPGRNAHRDSGRHATEEHEVHPGDDGTFAAATDELTAQAFVARNVQAVNVARVHRLGHWPAPTPFTGRRRRTGAGCQAQAQRIGRKRRQPDSLRGQAPASAPDTKPAIGLKDPLDSYGNLEPGAKYKGWILGALGIIFVAWSRSTLRAKPSADAMIATSISHRSSCTFEFERSVRQALKDERSALEYSLSLRQKPSETQYTEQKSGTQSLAACTRSLGRG